MMERGSWRDLPARSSTDEADRIAYARDLWPRHHLSVRAGRPADHKPGAIAWPESTAQVAQIVTWARREGVPLVPFGAGSGVCAGVLPSEDVVVVDLKRMARVRRLDAQAPLVDVEAGHMGVPFEEAMNRAGLTAGHFPSSILCSTVGGWVAGRSAGQCSGAYGKIEDMVVALECVTGAGDVVTLRRRTSEMDLVPLVVGSEGTLAIVTSSTLRLHPAPSSRAFGAWSFRSTEDGWEAIRESFQAGLRPAVARLYDPFDAMLAKQGSVKPASRRDRPGGHAPGLGGAALRATLRRPAMLNDLLHSRVAARALGGAMLVVVFEGAGEAPQRDLDRARGIVRGAWEGEGPARRWLQHRYSVSYRQAPVFANGAFSDTMEVAATWSRLGALYDGVRRALGEHAFVMAHFSHAYPDGCCIYFSFAGVGEEAYDRAWQAALRAAIEAGGTLSHHHGVGRSKAPRLGAELGTGIDVVRSLMGAFDPDRILNPGNLVPSTSTSTSTPTSTSTATATSTATLDETSLLALFEGSTPLDAIERSLSARGLTLDVSPLSATPLAEWLASGAPGARDRWLDPVDQLLAGLDATLRDGRALSIRPAPRRAVGPDLTALLVGAHGRFGRIDRAWLRVHRRGVARPSSSARFDCDRDPPLSASEAAIVAAVAAAARASGA